MMMIAVKTLKLFVEIYNRASIQGNSKLRAPSPEKLENLELIANYSIFKYI